MASLSLPRVLQLKKNSLDAEREQFERFQGLAIQKAINSVETPVKEKHVRSAIIGTFREQSAVTYWMVAIRLPLQENRIVAWKFCHVTHKLLREGHAACLDDSQRHIHMIENLGKLWVHLREGYGRLVNLYCNLLVCKIKFHARNPRFPGNMQLTAEELDAIAENDVNNYFQLCVELFDYMDEILTLQAAVFDSLGNARANSMTASGQCRLAALIPCAQDSSHIYDCNVRLLFRLHAALPADTLAGHRERFRQQFKKLSSFYKHASSLQYYRNLLTLPVLPSNPPNFLLQSDFGTYVAPVVSIPEPPPDEVDAVGSLIDTSDSISQTTTPDQMDAFEARATPSPQPDPIIERDRLIEHLQNELKRLRSERTQLVQERNTMLGSMREHCTQLETQLQSAKTELEGERQKTEILLVQTPEIKQKLTETEEKAKVTDEKFQKLKGAYTQLREEHIALIRQKAEVDKLSAGLRAAAAQHESAKTALQQQLNDKIKDVELLQQSASSSEEIEAYKNEISNLRVEIEQSRQKEVELETLRASMEALEIEHKTATTEQLEKLTTVENELKETKETLDLIKREKEEKDSELVKVKEELVGLREKSGDEYKKVVEEKEAALQQVAELTEQYQQEKEEQADCINKLHEDMESLRQNLIDSESNFVVKCNKLNEELSTNKEQFEKMLNEKDVEIKELEEKIVSLGAEFDAAKTKYETKNDELATCITNLQEELTELVKTKESSDVLLKELNAEKENIQIQLEKAMFEIKLLQDSVDDKTNLLHDLEIELAEMDTNNKSAYEELEKDKEQEIVKLKELHDAAKMKYETKNDEQATCITNLQEELTELIKTKESSDVLLKELNAEKESIQIQLEKAMFEIKLLQDSVDDKTNLLHDLEMELAETDTNNKCAYEELEKDKEQEIVKLKELHNIEVSQKQSEIISLRKLLEENTEFGNEQKSKGDYLLNTISDLEAKLAAQSKEIEELLLQLKETTHTQEKEKKEFEKHEKEYTFQITILEDKLKNVAECKDEIINNLKSMMETKDEQVISLNVEVQKLSHDVTRLQDELNETQAELEIAKNELFTFEEEHQLLVDRSDKNITLKNEELRTLLGEVEKLRQEKTEIIMEKEKIVSDFTLEQKVYENNIKELEEKHEKLENIYEGIQREKVTITNDLNIEIDRLKKENEQLKTDNDNEVQSLRNRIEEKESELSKQIIEKDDVIADLNNNLIKLKTDLEVLEQLVTKEKEDAEVMLTEKERNSQLIEARLEHTESKKLMVECELQDLLQHNTVLEADVTSLKRQLDEAQKELESQRVRVVKCAGEAALEVTKEAIASLERSNTQESNRTAAEMAAKALEELARHSEVKGNEETLARSAIFAAHNTAQLSAYVTDVCNISTDMQLSDKLTSECRTMLSTTKECLESVASGAPARSACEAAGAHVASVSRAALAADAQGSGARSVDDELADMDRAIEDAAGQIEKLIEASRAADSGVKLEVNGKILDACTTLMGAVKILVQDARKLQNELGDPKTRQKMYRRNPQWSEGLISAAKAVVFAAKLLVTSADEAVGSAGRVEGVSAAAHEVGGSTAQLVAASRARAPPASPALARLTQASRSVAAATGAVVAAVRAGAQLQHEQEALDTSALTLTATRRLEMESKVRSLELECALDAERAKLAALRKRHYQLAQLEENGGMTNGKE